jgi:hypothetical protein
MLVNYLTLGHDCSPAAALRKLNLRQFALPFDWTTSTISALEQCFATEFNNYHKDLHLHHHKTRLIDHYGFQFPHDYPLQSDLDYELNISTSLFGEGSRSNTITNEWAIYHDNVLKKYLRRIERFRNIVNDALPIIVLCRYATRDVLKLQSLLIKYYKKNDVYFVNSSRRSFENDKILNIYTEKNNIWNDENVWKQGIADIIKKIPIEAT